MKPMHFEFRSRRSMAVARRGMAATSSPLASGAAVAILRAGGTAADAAVAAAAVLNVVEPASTGIGGDCFALYYDAKTGRISALNGSGRAPSSVGLADVAAAMRARGLDSIDPRHGYAVTVPGAVAGWADLLARHGRMSLREVLADAIHYAREGFGVGPWFASAWKQAEPLLAAGRHAGEYLPGGRAPAAGQVVKLPALARTLEAIAEGGAAAFYEGPIGAQIAAAVQQAGGALTTDDLKAHRSTWDEPISAEYRGITVWECPPNGQGIAALQALRLLEGYDLGVLAPDGPERLHLMVEAMRLAFADARWYVADPATNPAPVAELLSDDYIRARRALISPAGAMQPPSFGRPLGHSDTVYLSVVDGEGSACSFINSLYMGFGVGFVVGETGVLLHNRGALFSLDPSHPNCFAPNKRPYHTIIPALATRDNALWACFGVMGGFMQPQGHVQVLSAMIDDDLNPQEALDRPRWMLADGASGGALWLEEGIPVATMARLAELGHAVRPVSGYARTVFGDGQIIRRDPETGVLYGGSDPRKDGLTAAF
ncbi:MAG: gamma-glutamyltransferase [Aggregatilineales bacterium]